MPYKQVIRADKLGGEVSSHAQQHARRVALSACEPFRDEMPPDQEYLDLYEYQVKVGEKLDQMRRELATIDDRHATEQELDRQLRDQRDAWVAEMREAMINLKETLDGSYGPGTSRRVFREDPPRLPDDPVALYRFSKRAFDTLSSPGFELKPTQPGVAINPRVLAQGFERPLGGLGEALERLHASRSETRHTQSEKDALLERALVYNGKVARLYEALYDIAGHERLAKRLRQSSHLRRNGGEGEAGPGPASAELFAGTTAADETAAGNDDGETRQEADA